MSSVVVAPVSASSDCSDVVQIEQQHLMRNRVGRRPSCARAQRSQRRRDRLLLAQIGQQGGLRAWALRRDELKNRARAARRYLRRSAPRSAIVGCRCCSAERSSAGRSHLFSAISSGRVVCAAIAASSSGCSGAVASSTSRTMSASAIASRDLAMPMVSASSVASRRPAVSISSTGMPSSETRSVTRSRVVPGVGRDDGAVALHQPVEQRRLARVGPPHNGQRKAIAHDAPIAEASAPARAAAPAPPRSAPQSPPRAARSMSSSAKSMPASSAAIRCTSFSLIGAIWRESAPPKLLRRHARLMQRRRFDQVVHRLGLREIEPPGKKRPLRELARFGQPRAHCECTRDRIWSSSTGEPCAAISTTSSAV